MQLIINLIHAQELLIAAMREHGHSVEMNRAQELLDVAKGEIEDFEEKMDSAYEELKAALAAEVRQKALQSQQEKTEAKPPQAAQQPEVPHAANVVQPEPAAQLADQPGGVSHSLGDAPANGQQPEQPPKS